MKLFRFCYKCLERFRAGVPLIKKLLGCHTEVLTDIEESLHSPYQIATQFTAEHIPIPACHQAQLGVGLWQNREIKNPYKWGSSTIAHILQKHEYLGYVNFIVKTDLFLYN